MGAELVVTGDGVARMRKLGIALRGQDKALRAELLAASRKAAAPIVADVRAAVQGIQVTGSVGGGTFARAKYAKRKPRGGHGLRSTIAAATGSRARVGGKYAGVQIVVNAKKLPPDQASLPWALDSPPGWRHPVFGQDVWVKQQGQPWFAVTIRRHQAAVQAQIGAAMDATTEKLTKIT
jgi:hypothetical protein